MFRRYPPPPNARTHEGIGYIYIYSTNTSLFRFCIAQMSKNRITLVIFTPATFTSHCPANTDHLLLHKMCPVFSMCMHTVSSPSSSKRISALRPRLPTPPYTHIRFGQNLSSNERTLWKPFNICTWSVLRCSYTCSHL